MEEKILQFDKIEPFEFQIRYNDAPPSKKEVPLQHCHSECEICITLGGDASFMVENNIYPVSEGSVIISRPYENHHCIYHSDVPHDHFWILFSCDKNQKYFDLFFKRKAGEGNLIVLKSELKDEFVKISKKLLNDDLDDFEKYSCFFKIISILNSSSNELTPQTKLPPEIEMSIDYILKNLASQISIKFLAKSNHMSLNTFERHFKKCVGITPSAYVLRSRLSRSRELLRGGASVGEAREKSGFSDDSSFIVQFKKHFGLTPLKYKNSVNKP